MDTSCRLLILDDEVAIAETIAAMAAAGGAQTRVTTNPVAFFQAIVDWQPSHIAVDLMMPGMDGVQVLARMAELKVAAAIVITSGLGGRILESAQRAGIEHGLDIAGILGKPFSATQLHQLLQPRGAAASQAPGRAAAPDYEIDRRSLETALADRALFVAYQPKLNCRTRQVVGFEALARWRHPQWGMVPPDRFIVAAESFGLMRGVTEQVIGHALDWFAGARVRLRKQFQAGLVHPDCALSINLSAAILEHEDVLDSLVARCEALGVPPGDLILELTETSAMTDALSSLGLLTRLRVRGFQLSIDDFGTGYSSMSQLARLPFSEIKVDKSFVLAVTSSREARAVVKSVVDLGRTMGMTTTAEGVEDEATLDYLCDIDCELAQGYLFSRPLPGPEIEAWLATLAAPASTVD
jgi:EAL domain-containing protein (putative c-di-GMP-specific phosphodiesterase class I)/ActR/RegA family two-component response regulator